MIVDVHAHLGYDQVFDEDFTSDELLTSQSENRIDMTIVQPGTCHRLEDVVVQHDNIAELTRSHPGRFYGMANPNPHLSPDEYRCELSRCVTELGFVGVKLHPNAHALSPSSRDGRRAIEAAARFGIPVMIHTGSGIPWSLPSNIAPVARDFPEVTFIVAHSGHMLLAGEALALACDYPNVVLETSWTAGFLLKRFVEAIGAARVLFASDHADNAGAELAKVRTAGLAPTDLDEVLGGAAARIYRLPRA